jgi:hypothetical protein
MEVVALNVGGMIIFVTILLAYLYKITAYFF